MCLVIQRSVHQTSGGSNCQVGVTYVIKRAVLATLLSNVDRFITELTMIPGGQEFMSNPEAGPNLGPSTAANLMESLNPRYSA